MIMTVRLLLLVFGLAGCLAGCAADPAGRFLTEHDARLICAARSAAVANGFPLAGRIYQVRPDGDGWVVAAEFSPEYSGTGVVWVVGDAAYFVKFDAAEHVQEILSFGERVKPVTRPSGD
jgi:hypothetical protein